MSDFYLIKSNYEIKENNFIKYLGNINYKKKIYKKKYFQFKSNNFFYNIGILSDDSYKNYIYKYKDYLILFYGTIYFDTVNLAKNIPKKILKGYITYGERFFKKLNGNFVIIILDLKKDKIRCVRDRFGSNVLFYYNKKNFLSIFTKIRIFRNTEEIKLNPSLEQIKLFLSKNYRYSYGLENSFFENIKIFKPNSITTFNRYNYSSDKNLFFYKINIKKININLAKKKLLNLLNKSLKKRYIPVKKKSAFLLSGGLDSPAIASLAKNLTKKIKTFSICYKDYSKIKINKRELVYDESFLIKDIIKFNYFKSYFIYPSSKSFKTIFNEMMTVHDEPISSPTWYSHFVLCKKLFDKKIEYVFGGDGGDHLFAGLYDDIPYYFADLKAIKKYNILNKEINLWIKYHNHPVFKKSKKLFNSYCKKCFDFKKKGIIQNYTWDEDLFRKSPENKVFYKNKTKLNKFFFPSFTKSFLKSKLIQDLLYSSSPPSTRAEIPNFSYYNLKCRSVFLDNNFVNFCWNLPGNFLIKNGYTKWILRVALKNYLPDNVIWNKNHVGLNAPANIWFRGNLKKDLIKNINELLLRKNMKFISKKRIRKIISNHFSKKDNHMMFLWKLYAVENWLKTWEIK